MKNVIVKNWKLIVIFLLAQILVIGCVYAFVLATNQPDQITIVQDDGKCFMGQDIKLL